MERLCAAIVSLPPPVLEVPRRASQGSWRPGCPPDRQDRWPCNPSPLGNQQMSAISSSLSTLAGLALPEPHAVEWGTASTLFRGIGYSRYPIPWNRAPKVFYSVLLSKSIFYSTHRQVPSNSVKMKKNLQHVTKIISRQTPSKSVKLRQVPSGGTVVLRQTPSNSVELRQVPSTPVKPPAGGPSISSTHLVSRSS